MKIFHFSGGGSSAMMVIQNYSPGDIVIFCDTGREVTETYQFINDFELHTKIPIIKLSNLDWQKDVIIKQKVIPNKFKRKCTIELKIKQARRYLRSIGLVSYVQCIGFRADEKRRIHDYRSQWKKVTTIFPLEAAGITSNDVAQFGANFNWWLSIPSILKNCDLCFLKGIDNIIAIIQSRPDTVDKWIEDEENKEINPNGHTYHAGITMRMLKHIALSSDKKYTLENRSSALGCSCTS